MPLSKIEQSSVNSGVAGTGPAFSAGASGNTSLPSSTFVKMILASEEFDTANCFDNATNYRFTPNVAGYYQVNGCVSINASAGNNFLTSIFKNGSEFKRGNQAGPNASGNVAVTINALIYLNGSTDYIELYGYQNSGGTVNAGNNITQTYFQASLTRAA